MAFFQAAIGGLQTVVVGIGSALGLWGAINLLEGYGNDNAGSRSQGIKQFVAGGGIVFLGVTLVPELAKIFV